MDIGLKYLLNRILYYLNGNISILETRDRFFSLNIKGKEFSLNHNLHFI